MPSWSGTFALWTLASTSSPSVSTRMWRFRTDREARLRDRSQHGSNTLPPLDGLLKTLERPIRGPVSAFHQKIARANVWDAWQDQSCTQNSPSRGGAVSPTNATAGSAEGFA